MSTQPLLQAQKRIALPTRVEPKVYILIIKILILKFIQFSLLFTCQQVFFANERTFLSWLQFTVVLGGLALGLLNFGDKVGKISAAIFTFVGMLHEIFGFFKIQFNLRKSFVDQIAMAIMLYALLIYHWRATKIRKRESGPYDDRYGPTVLCFFLVGKYRFIFSHFIYLKN